MNQDVIQITSDPIGTGVERACFAHPDNPDKAIKVSIKRRDLQSKREIKYYKKLRRRKHLSYKHIPKYYGTVKTNLGEGFVVDLIRDHNGKVSKSLLWYLKKGYPISEFEPYLHDLKKYFMKNLIIFNYDMIANNLLFQKQSKKKARLVLIDGIGDIVYIKWFNVFPSHVKSKIDRRWGRFIRRLYRAKAIRKFNEKKIKKIKSLKPAYRRQLKPKQKLKSFNRYFK